MVNNYSCESFRCSHSDVNLISTVIAKMWFHNIVIYDNQKVIIVGEIRVLRKYSFRWWEICNCNWHFHCLTLMLVCHYYPAELMHIIINYLSKCASANTMCICHLLKFLPSRFQESYLWLFFNHLWFQRELFISSSHYLYSLRVHRGCVRSSSPI